MKAEERKELKTNTLVHTLERVKDGLKQGPSRRTVVILGIVGLLVLLIVVWNIAAGVSERRNSARWEKISAATSPEDLESLATEFKNTAQGRVARLQIARNNLQDGLGAIYIDNSGAVTKLSHAADEFEKLAKDFKATTVLVQECLFGAAQAREAVGEFDRSQELYADIAKRWPDSQLGQQAEQNADRLKEKKAELEKIQAALKNK
jgi:hypothetical protein